MHQTIQKELLINNKQAIIDFIRAQPQLITTYLAAQHPITRKMCYCAQGAVLKVLGLTPVAIHNRSANYDVTYGMRNNEIFTSEGDVVVIDGGISNFTVLELKDVYAFMKNAQNRVKHGGEELDSIVSTIGKGLNTETTGWIDLRYFNDYCKPTPELMADVLEYCWREL